MKTVTVILGSALAFPFAVAGALAGKVGWGIVAELARWARGRVR